jgi:hypothetical protein
MHEMNHVVDTNKRLVEGGRIAAFEPTLSQPPIPTDGL